MCRITRVDALDNQTLDIQFDSGHVLLLDLNALRGDPAIAALLEGGDWCRPRTDGAAVYWRDGPRLSAQQLINELTQGGNDT